MKKKKSLIVRKNRLGYFFVLPWIIGFFLFFAVPFFQTVQYSFGEVTIQNGINFTFKGIDTYLKAFSRDADFLPNLSEAVINMVVDTPIILVFSLLAASLIQGEYRGRWLVRMVFFIPIIYGTGILMQVQRGDMMYYVLRDRISGNNMDRNSLTGLLIQSVNINRFFSYISGQIPVMRTLFNYIASGAGRLFEIINRSGVQVLIFLAALKSIPPHMYEVGKIEGATAFEMFWKVTLPLLVPHIITVTVFTIVDSFTNVTNPMVNLIQQRTFQSQDFSYGSTQSVIYFVIISAIVAVTMGGLTIVQKRKEA